MYLWIRIEPNVYEIKYAVLKTQSLNLNLGKKNRQNINILIKIIINY